MMKNEAIYSTKEVKNAMTISILEATNNNKGMGLGSGPVYYRDRNKGCIRYKLLWRPKEEIINNLRRMLPGAEVKPFTWKRWHPLAPNGWTEEVIVIKVPLLAE